MIKKLILALVITAFISLSLTGCWDRKELDGLGIVLAIGLDKDSQTGDILLTSQIVRPSALKNQGGSNKEASYEIVITSGTTIFEAARNTVKEFDRRSFFSHVKVIVVGEALARDGMNDIIDFVSRSHELRKSTWLIVTEGTEAREILGLKHGLENVQANYLEGIIKRQKTSLDITTSNVIDFIKSLPGEGINPITGVVKISNVESIPPEATEPKQRQGLVLSGTAAYNKDKLVGFLSKEETLGLNLLIGNKKKVIVNVPSPLNDKDDMSIEIQNIDSTIKPIIKGSKLSFILEVKAVGNITEVKDSLDVSNLENFYKVNEKFTEFIKSNLNIAVKKIQKDLKTDILGFGTEFQRKYPKEWNKSKGQWDAIFPKVSYEISVSTSLKRTGLLIKPISSKKSDK